MSKILPGSSLVHETSTRPAYQAIRARAVVTSSQLIG